MIPLPYPLVIKEKTAGILESFGRFSRILMPGMHIIWPWQRVAGRISLQIQEMNVHVETKSIDDVFVKITIAVQYYVMPDRIREAFYELANPRMQIESYVYDEVRACVPKMKLDDVFQNKDEIATAVKTGLEETMNQYGYDIVKSLVNDIDPDAGVKKAMNDINAAQRHRKAAEERGEAEKILRVKQAEAEAQSAILRGRGIAGQRKAIIDGLRQSVEEFQRSVPGTSTTDVMQIVILTQYFDTLKEIGGNARTNTLMIPHSPGSIGDLSEQIQRSIMMGNLAADALTSAAEQPAPPAPASSAALDMPDLGPWSAPPEEPGEGYQRTTPPR